MKSCDFLCRYATLVQPSPLSRNYTHPEWGKGLEKSLWTPHIQHNPLWSTLQSSEHQNDQTQKQFLPSGNPSHEHLTLNMEHTTLLYIIYSSHNLFTFQICTYHTYTYRIVYIICCVLCCIFFISFFCTLPILYIIILLSVSCPVSVFLLHCGASVTITNSSYV